MQNLYVTVIAIYFASMTLFEFDLLDEKEKAHVIWEIGVHLATRFTVLYTIALYQIESFYIEVFFDQQEHKIIKMKSFLSTEPLTPYLKKIDLSWLKMVI